MDRWIQLYKQKPIVDPFSGCVCVHVCVSSGEKDYLWGSEIQTKSTLTHINDISGQIQRDQIWIGKSVIHRKSLNEKSKIFRNKIGPLEEQ